MSRFTAPLVVTPMNDGKTWKIWHSTTTDGDPTGIRYSKQFGYDIGEEGSGISVEVGAGFFTDFASVPRPLWWLLPKWGRYGNAAVIHDYLYRGGPIRNQLPHTSATHHWFEKHERKRADDIMLEAMEVMNTPRWQKYLIYAGIRLTGWVRWNKNRR